MTKYIHLSNIALEVTDEQEAILDGGHLFAKFATICPEADFKFFRMITTDAPLNWEVYKEKVDERERNQRGDRDANGDVGNGGAADADQVPDNDSVVG